MTNYDPREEEWEEETIAEKIVRLSQYQGEDSIQSSNDLWDAIQKEAPVEVINTRFPLLDETINGVEPGELIAVSGPRKSGKTLFCQTLTVNFDRQHKHSLWFSYELTIKQFLRCFDGMPPMLFMPMKLKAHSLIWIEERIIEAIAKHSIRVVFIDHLHFLFDIARSRNASMEIGQVVRFLKKLATELNIVIFVLCHMRKIQPGKEPDDTDFRDSSLVASESDTGLIVWRIKDHDNRARLKVCYSRRTGAWEKTIEIVKTESGMLGECDAEF